MNTQVAGEVKMINGLVSAQQHSQSRIAGI